MALERTNNALTSAVTYRDRDPGEALATYRALGSAMMVGEVRVVETTQTFSLKVESE